MPKRADLGEKIVKATWVAEAITLAVRGWSTRRIGKRLNRHHSTVAEALNAEFARVRPSEEDVQRRRQLLGEQLEEQIAKWRRRANTGDKDSAMALARFYDRYAKLYGLDAPSRTEHTGKDGAPIASMAFDMSKLTDAQIDRLLAGDSSVVDGGRGNKPGDPPGDPSASVEGEDPPRG